MVAGEASPPVFPKSAEETRQAEPVIAAGKEGGRGRSSLSMLSRSISEKIRLLQVRIFFMSAASFLGRIFCGVLGQFGLHGGEEIDA